MRAKKKGKGTILEIIDERDGASFLLGFMAEHNKRCKMIDCVCHEALKNVLEYTGIPTDVNIGD